MRTLSVACLVLLFSLSLCSPAAATPPVWQFDEAHSNFYFSIRHIFSKTYGSFQDFSGELRFDPEELDGSSFAFTVQTKSIDTKISKRDNHLRSEDFFHVAEYPEMTFKSTDIRRDSQGGYQVTGILRIKDVSKEMTLPFTFHGSQEHPLSKGKLVAGFETQFSLDRLAFGVGTGKFYKLGVVGKTVTVVVTLEMLRNKD